MIEFSLYLVIIEEDKEHEQAIRRSKEQSPPETTNYTARVLGKISVNNQKLQQLQEVCVGIYSINALSVEQKLIN